VIGAGRKLSFKQFGNGTVLIGGGHLATPCPPAQPSASPTSAPERSSRWLPPPRKAECSSARRDAALAS